MFSFEMFSKIAGLNLAKASDISGEKIHIMPSFGGEAVCPMSQICGM
jgi:hypothetical protein